MVEFRAGNMNTLTLTLTLTLTHTPHKSYNRGEVENRGELGGGRSKNDTVDERALVEKEPTEATSRERERIARKQRGRRELLRAYIRIVQVERDMSRLSRMIRGFGKKYH